jgi:hypothetical protein
VEIQNGSGWVGASYDAQLLLRGLRIGALLAALTRLLRLLTGSGLAALLLARLLRVVLILLRIIH